MRSNRTPRITVLVVGLTTGLAAAAGPGASAQTQTAPVARVDGSWLQWGGPTGDFRVDVPGLADRWPEGGPPRLWKRPLGQGYSSLLYRDGVLYTMYREGEEEVVVALDAPTGETRWQHRYPRELWPDMTPAFGVGPNGTPALVGDRLVSIGIDGQLRCVSVDDGRLLWKRDLPAEFGRRSRQEEYGYSASPLVYDGVVIVHVGGDDHAIVAFDPKDGSIVWASAPGAVSYAQPTLTRLAGRDQFVYFAPEGIHALDPRTGAHLWHHPIPVDNGNHLTPMVRCDDTHLWVSSQFLAAGGRLLEVIERDGGLHVEEKVYERRLRASHWTMIAIDGHVYGSTGGNDVSFLTAFDWRTGKIVWRERGFHKAQALLADGKLIWLDEAGQLAMGRVSPEGLELLAQAPMTDSVSWTLPTLIGTTLYLRDATHAMALDLSARPSAAAATRPSAP